MFGTGTPGETNTLSQTDLQVMEALGWDPAPPAPVVTATNQTVEAGQSVPLSSIFSVSGSGITEYRIWFSYPQGGDPADGTVTNNGTPIAADQWDTVSSLSGLAFVGAVTPGSDHIWLQAYNGVWSNSSQVTITDPGLAVITPNNPQYSTTGPWSAWAGTWGASSLTYGVDYTQSINLNNATFPNGTLFSWSFPLFGGPFGVWSYPCIVYGSTPELINSTVPSTQVANFVNLSTSYSTALTVNSGQLDTIFDIWLTSKPYGDTSTVKYELEIAPQTDWQYSPLTYTLTDSTLDNAAVYVDPGKIIVVPSSEMLTGNISISDILKSLIWNGVITGQEYISGIEFGPEPGSGSGSLLVNSLNYQWTSTSTVQLTASNDTFTITTPGGNDIEGNGGHQYLSGLYSQFQIKTSGSETLVSQNTNISTLDYLQDVTFIQFSDGVYNTLTATFTPTHANSAAITQTETSSSTSPAAIGNSGAASIGAGATLELTGADSAPVVFAASTGMLTLDQPSTFSGTISGFTGNGSLSGSDQIDLKGINFSSLQDSYANGVLTVTDGAHSATLNFHGSYTLANFKFADDGNGGTIVYDPPAPNLPSIGEGTQVSIHPNNGSFVFHPNAGTLCDPAAARNSAQPQ